MLQTVAIRTPKHLCIKDNSLIIREKGSSVVLGKIALSDIWVIIIDNPQVTITSALISGINDAGIGVLYCGSDHMPNGLALPLGAHSRHAETVEYIIVILAVVVIGGGLMGFGNQVSGQIGITGNSISSWFGKANGAGDNASGGNGSGGGNNAGGENKGDENSGSQLQAPTVSVTGMDVVGERVTAKVSNLPAGATQVSYQWQYSSTKTGTFSDIKYGGNTNSYEISEEDEDYYLRCKVTTSSSKGKVPDAYSETIGEVYVFDWSKYPTGSYRPRFNGNSLACCAAPYNSSTQIPSLGEGDYASIVFDNELSDIPQGNITYRWFKCFGLGNGAAGVVKELGSSPSLSLSGLQGSYINCEVTLTVNGKSKTFVPKAICNGKVSDGIYVRPRIG